MSYVPLEEDTDSRRKPVAVWIAVTWACGKTRPEASVTVPFKPARSTCAKPWNGKQASNTAQLNAFIKKQTRSMSFWPRINCQNLRYLQKGSACPPCPETRSTSWYG